MAEPSPDHWDAIIATCGVLSGVIVSQATAMFAAWLERHERKNETLLRKLDELTNAALDVLHWYKEIQNSPSLSHLQGTPPSIPCYRIVALTILYFQDLKPTVSAYTGELRSYYSWAIRHAASFGNVPSFPHSLGVCLHIADGNAAKQYAKSIQDHHEKLASQVEIQARLYLTHS